MDFGVPDDHRVKLKESENRNEYLDLEKTEEYESEVYTNCNWRSRYSHRRIIKGLDDSEIRR